MMNKISTAGIIAVIIYLIFVGALFVYAANCESSFCELTPILATLPWLILSGLLDRMGYFGFEWLNNTSEHQVYFWIIVSINTLILYCLFAALQRRLNK